MNNKPRILLASFGRLEKLLLFHLFKGNFDIVGIISEHTPAEIAYFLQYDSNHGKFFASEIKTQISKNGNKLIFQNDEKTKIDLFLPKKITTAKLKELKIDFIVDCSEKLKLSNLIKYKQCARKVFILANDEVKKKLEHHLIAFHFNQTHLSLNHKFVSIPPIESATMVIFLRALQDKLQIQSCVFHIVQGPTHQVNTLDTFSQSKDLKLGRSIFNNIIPFDLETKTNVTKELLLQNDILIDIQGSGVLVPIPAYGLLKLTLEVGKTFKVSEINELLNQESDAQIGFSFAPLVTKDVESINYYGVIDGTLTQILSTKNNQMITLGIWFDCESSMAVCLFKTLEFAAGLEDKD